MYRNQRVYGGLILLIILALVIGMILQGAAQRNGGSSSLTATEDSQPVASNCTRSLAYWVAHPERYPVSIVIGDQRYPREQITSILSSTNPGQEMLQQVVVAFLNSAMDGQQSPIAGELQEAYQWLVAHPVGAVLGDSDSQNQLHLLSSLKNYNEGLAGYAPCEGAYTPAPTRTPAPSLTSTGSNTPTPTSTPTPSRTATLSPTLTGTATDSATPSSSPSATATELATVTASPTATETSTPTPTPTPTVLITYAVPTNTSAPPRKTPRPTNTPTTKAPIPATKTPIPVKKTPTPTKPITKTPTKTAPPGAAFYQGGWLKSLVAIIQTNEQDRMIP